MRSSGRWMPLKHAFGSCRPSHARVGSEGDRGKRLWPGVRQPRPRSECVSRKANGRTREDDKVRVGATRADGHNRRRLAAALGQALAVEAAPPGDFAGIPVVHNQRTRFSSTQRIELLKTYRPYGQSSYTRSVHYRLMMNSLPPHLMLLCASEVSASI
jgi:hypothetical protein